MENPVEALEAIAGVLIDVLSADGTRILDDDSLLMTAAALEALGRVVDAQRVAVAAEIGHRSRVELDSNSLAVVKGCRNVSELVQRVTRVSAREAAGRLRLGRETRPQFSLGGMEFPARFPHVAGALASGLLGVDSAAAIIAGLIPALDHASIDGLDAAEVALVAAATGATDESPVACTADDIRIQALVWQAVLDPDGLEPAEERALAQRGFSRGTLRGGLVRGTYAFVPEVFGKLDRVFDSCMSPKAAPAFLSTEELVEHEDARDPRTPDQQRHDILAAVVDIAARSGEIPTIGGAAPTVLVSVRADDLSRDHGAGYLDGVEAPISMTAIKQFACAGGIQKITLSAEGGILELGSVQRCFTGRQRRAIALRDGGCVIPGCRIPASWCEIHHVVPASKGGATHTDNGVLLCWFHHRTIDTSGWRIRMDHGAVYIRPPGWIDREGRWRHSTKSRTALSTALSETLARRRRRGRGSQVCG